MVQDAAPARKLLILNPASGSSKPEVLDHLRQAFAEHRVLLLQPGQDLAEAYRACPTTPDALVVAAGGDGTIGGAVRCLAGSRQTLGIIPMGTFNNFSRALGIPTDLDRAIEAIQRDRARPVTLGRANGKYFMEAATIGAFGQALALGEAAKERQAGDLAARVGALAGAPQFAFRLRGDLSRRGRAYSLVVANTPSIGARLEVAGTTPRQPELELSISAGRTRLDILGRLIRSLLPGRPRGHDTTFRIRRLEISTDPPVAVFADLLEIGRTPVVIEADPAALSVLLS